MSAKKSRLADPAKFPALSAFLAGYLHQDFQLDHQTPAGAARAFHRDADATDRAALSKEAARFLAATESIDWSLVRDALDRLGSAWAPRTRADLVRLLTTLSKPPRA